MKKLKRVRPEDFDVESLMLAAREGRLFVDACENMVSKQEVITNVRAYVGRIRVLATPRFCSLVDELWEQILANDDIVDFLMPGPQARKCKSFNKYAVMRIIGVLRENGVYQMLSDPTFDALLEPDSKDSIYRKSLGEGVRQPVLMAELKKILWNLQL